MRRGSKSGGLEIGGEWDWSEMRRVEVVTVGDSMNSPASPSATGENAPAADVGWPISTCVVAIVLQQSSP